MSFVQSLLLGLLQGTTEFLPVSSSGHLYQLVDTAPPVEIRDKLRSIALGVPGVEGVHMLRSRYQGAGIEVDMHVAVDGDVTVTRGFMICTQFGAA